MQKTTKVAVENGSMKKEINCEFFVGMMISQESTGYSCDQLIAGVTSPDGILSAIRMLKKMEDQLYEILPVPRELAELELAMEESLQKAMEKKDTEDGQNSGKQDDPFLSAIKIMLEGQDDEDNPLKKFFGGINRSGSSGGNRF